MDIDLNNNIKNYCSKCAIMLVSRGFKVVENEEIIRKNEIEGFLEKIDTLNPQVSQILMSV